jgi:hypothetical protein
MPRASRHLSLLSALLLITFIPVPPSHGGYSFSSHTFTPCGAEGKSGPTQTNCRTSYTTSWDESNLNFTVSNGIQLWVVPATGGYQILAKGAKGGSGTGGTGGHGASLQGDFQLTEGDVIKILVGQIGVDRDGVSSRFGGGGGGGGSFVATNSNSPLIIAGGGGGSSLSNSTGGNRNGVGGVTTTSGTDSRDTIGKGGTSGAGGTMSTLGDFSGAGGGGYTGNGSSSRQMGSNGLNSGGFSFLNGGVGGTAQRAYNYGGDGGFGGGGAGSYGAGGGGGYSGGGADFTIGNLGTQEGGGGGGSYNAGTNQINTEASNNATGSVTISLLIATNASISTAGGAALVNTGTPIAITATVDQPGRVTFFANRKRIAGCINRLAISTTAICNWRPTIQGVVQLHVELKPTSAGFASSISGITTLIVQRRSGARV